MGKKHPTNNPDNMNTAPVAAGEDEGSNETSPEPGPAWPHGLTAKTVRARERLLSSLSKRDLAIIIATTMDRDSFHGLCAEHSLL